MDNVTALKALYTALGGSSDLSAANTSVEVLNAISTLLSGEGGATLNPDAIANNHSGDRLQRTRHCYS